MKHTDGRPMQKRWGYWWPNGGESYGQRYIRHADDMARALARCTGRRMAIQAGGHVGVWPCWLSRHFQLVATVEPEADNFLALRENVRNMAGKGRILYWLAALGHEAGQTAVKVNRSNIGGHKLIPGSGISVLTVDELAGLDCEVDLIVLDVEGFEYPALIGAMRTLQRCRPVIMLEDRGHAEKKHSGVKGFGEISRYLAEFGYLEVERVAKDVIFQCQSKKTPRAG